MPGSDDDRLIERVAAGDRAAWGALVERQLAAVVGFAWYQLGDRAAAEDVAQETFLSLHRHGHRFRGDARFSTFVYRVASNAALNRRRTLGRNRARSPFDSKFGVLMSHRPCVCVSDPVWCLLDRHTPRYTHT